MELPIPRDVEPVTDVGPVGWPFTNLRPWGTEGVRVGSLVPEGFEAYGRILNPIAIDTPGGGTVRWAEVAERSGVLLGPETSFRQAARLAVTDHDGWPMEPAEGELPLPQVRSLVRALANHTDSADRCWFAVWDGYGQWGGGLSFDRYPGEDPEGAAARYGEAMAEADHRLGELDTIPKVAAEHRAYYLFRGPIEAAAGFADEPFHQSPNLWWPEDRAWLVATEVDGFSTYVGGSTACLHSVIHADDLEVIEVPLDARTDPGAY